MNSKPPVSVASVVKAAVESLTPKTPPHRSPKRATRNLRGSHTDLRQWLTVETQARVIALAAEFQWDVQRVLTLAVNLFTVQVRDPEKRSKLLAALPSHKEPYAPTRHIPL